MTIGEVEPGGATDAAYSVPDLTEEARATAALVRLVRDRTGYDFAEYQPPFLTRRLRQLAVRLHLSGGVVELLEVVRADDSLCANVIDILGIAVTEMFRDPQFFVSFRDQVVPELRSHPLVRIWVAGCATGEEAYSFAILLEEEGFADRYQIYATDINRRSLLTARSGVIDASQMRKYSQNYLNAGGRASLSNYYTAHTGQALIRPHWRRRIVVAHHNLTVDAKFNTFNVIACRNVLIYFNRSLHARTHALLHESLAPGGYLALGARESLGQSDFAAGFRCVEQSTRIYQRID